MSRVKARTMHCSNPGTLLKNRSKGPVVLWPVGDKGDHRVAAILLDDYTALVKHVAKSLKKAQKETDYFHAQATIILNDLGIYL